MFLWHICEETGTLMLLTAAQGYTTPIGWNVVCLAKQNCVDMNTLT